MNTRGLTLIEISLVILVIALLAAILLPPLCGPKPHMQCANHLRQLYTLGTVYASMHKGEWPDVSGEELWLSFTRTNPPLIALEERSILYCPILGDERGSGETDYSGPGMPWKKLGLGEAVGGDKPGNHGEQEGGYVLYKDGRVVEVEAIFLRR